MKTIVLKGKIWSQVGGLSPLLKKEKKKKKEKALLLQSISRRSKVKSVSVTPGPSWAVFGSISSLLVQSYYTLLSVEASY